MSNQRKVDALLGRQLDQEITGSIGFTYNQRGEVITHGASFSADIDTTDGYVDKAKVLVDFLPVVGTVAGFASASSELAYAIEVLGLLPGGKLLAKAIALKKKLANAENLSDAELAALTREVNEDLASLKDEAAAPSTFVDPPTRGTPSVSKNVCSFHGDTQVLTRTGYQAIRDLNAGVDQVWSRNEYTGQMDWKPIRAQYHNTYEATASVTLRDHEGGAAQTIISNKIHPYFIQTDRQVTRSSEGHVYRGVLEHGYWVDAANLQAGDRLLNDDSSWAEVVGVVIEDKPLKAYNLTVVDFHTYFVAGNDHAAPVWVHNDCFEKLKANLNGIPPNKVAKIIQQLDKSPYKDEILSYIDSGMFKHDPKGFSTLMSKFQQKATQIPVLQSLRKAAELKNKSEHAGSTVRLEVDHGSKLNDVDVALYHPDGSMHTAYQLKTSQHLKAALGGIKDKLEQLKNAPATHKKFEINVTSAETLEDLSSDKGKMNKISNYLKNFEDPSLEIIINFADGQSVKYKKGDID